MPQKVCHNLPQECLKPLPQIGTCHIKAINGLDSGPEIRPRTRKTSAHISAVYYIRIWVYLEDIKLYRYKAIDGFSLYKYSGRLGFGEI